MMLPSPPKMNGSNFFSFFFFFSSARSRSEPGAPAPLIHIAIACCEADPTKRPELSQVIETLKELYLELAKKPFTPPKTTLPVPRKSIKIPGKARQKMTASKPLPNEHLTTKLEGDVLMPKLNMNLNDDVRLFLIQAFLVVSNPPPPPSLSSLIA